MPPTFSILQCIFTCDAITDSFVVGTQPQMSLKLEKNILVLLYYGIILAIIW